MGDEMLDAVVIGAGISGIFAAKFYLDIHPGCQLLVLDRDICVGGTWNSRRSYDSFWTQWTVGTAEFSDLPMPRPPEEDTYYELFKAKYTTQYLETYVDHQIFAGKSLRERVRFSTEVQSVIKTDGDWVLSTKNLVSGSQETLRTAKLIVASGTTSIQNMPILPGVDDFAGKILHQENFGSSDVLTSSKIQNITVLGGGKSSADMVYESVKAGKTVSWVLKETETTGPGFFLSPKGVGPYKNAFEAGTTRFAATFVPSFMSGYPWWTGLLNSTKYGMKLMRGFWAAIDGDVRKEGNFENRQCLEGFENLAPHGSIFWENGTGGFLNHADFFDVVAKNVRVHCSDIDHLEKDLLKLKSGRAVPCDAILCGTGWKHSVTFFSEDTCRQLGLPHLSESDPSEYSKHWTELNATADGKVLASFPGLACPEPHYHKPPHLTPYRLYRNVAPITQSISDREVEDRSVVFVGLVGVGNYFPAVECQSMWATAYMDGKLSVPSREEQEMEVALFSTWCKRRYLSNGEEGNNMTFELIGYCDGLLKDLGLRSHRKGWFKDLFFPLAMRNYSGLKEEYVAKYGRDQIV